MPLPDSTPGLASETLPPSASEPPLLPELDAEPLPPPELEAAPPELEPPWPELAASLSDWSDAGAPLQPIMRTTPQATRDRRKIM